MKEIKKPKVHIAWASDSIFHQKSAKVSLKYYYKPFYFSEYEFFT